jgi:two-component system, OmpR family, sensor histidine kinase KdpD
MNRPNPDDLLDKLQREEEKRHRGRLKIFFGASAGVGKTYAMLQAARRRHDAGDEVLIGIVETHGRSETAALMEGLAQLPPASIVYRNRKLAEFDLDAALERHPQLLLVDELAHSNVPGARHMKRWQDVHELLDAGIDVYTTVNVQHLESLNDVVASITGVRVRETLPDWILDQAEEVELIDISPYALRQRMRHGNIYPPERIDTALKNFFREGNLTALRELALRRVAEKTESQLEQYMTEHGISERWQATERVLVGFDARPHTREVIRDAWRLSHGLHADFIAVCIQPEGYLAFTSKLIGWLKYRGDAKRHREEALRRLEEHATLAEDLGAEVIRTSSPDIARKLVEIARERQATQLVLGQPARSHWEELIRGSIINRLLRLDAGIDIHLVPRSHEE